MLVLLGNESSNIPKFTFATKYLMAKNYGDMGNTVAFTPEADFSVINGRKDFLITR